MSSNIPPSPRKQLCTRSCRASLNENSRARSLTQDSLAHFSSHALPFFSPPSFYTLSLFPAPRAQLCIRYCSNKQQRRNENVRSRLEGDEESAQAARKTQRVGSHSQLNCWVCRASPQKNITSLKILHGSRCGERLRIRQHQLADWGCVWTCCRNDNLGNGDMTDKHLFTLVDTLGEPASSLEGAIIIDTCDSPAFPTP